jgi:hypothetical protein
METVGDIDRAALYITRRDLVGGGVDLVPAVVLPSAEEEWMFSQVSYVQQKKSKYLCVCGYVYVYRCR